MDTASQCPENKGLEWYCTAEEQPFARMTYTSVIQSAQEAAESRVKIALSILRYVKEKVPRSSASLRFPNLGNPGSLPRLSRQESKGGHLQRRPNGILGHAARQRGVGRTGL